MALKGYIPTINSTVKIAIALVIIFLALKWLPIPENIKQLFRV